MSYSTSSLSLCSSHIVRYDKISISQAQDLQSPTPGQPRKGLRHQQGREQRIRRRYASESLESANIPTPEIMQGNSSDSAASLTQRSPPPTSLAPTGAELCRVYTFGRVSGREDSQEPIRIQEKQ
ncbi:uncharacterized protein L3040_007790 [Drepanopeziza brunnea f. sp. 'multigermtubi']|uniref:uncharacterized protein n=1 Tax=Drepanopeziza brunnea f. sp. 'multigermtubi' TaxID=698441 RepID=UPI0023831DE7|nr:hypothetical protein L3040_007790 [Drepanopeziza brunnea f. sp. 'multigermtubi']